MDCAYPVPCSQPLSRWVNVSQRLYEWYHVNGFIAEPFPLIDFHFKRATVLKGPVLQVDMTIDMTLKV